MLTTVQPYCSSVFQCAFGPCGVIEFALGVVVQYQQPQRGEPGLPLYMSISSSPLVFPAARMGRLPIRLQIRTGFTGPSSNTSSAGSISRSP